MKYKILSVILLALVMKAKAAPGITNNTYSQLTISNMFYTNRIALQTADSNISYQATNNYVALSNSYFALSNMFFTYTNGTISSNILVISPGPRTNSVNITNGTLRGVVPVP